MRSNSDIEQTVELHGSTVWRVCTLYFSAKPDAQDAFQEALLKYALADAARFNDEEHRKAWLIRVATNVCKDMLKARHRTETPLDDQLLAGSGPVSNDPLSQPASFSSEVIDALRALDDPPRTPLYLALYEGYSAPEISQLTEAPVNTVYSWLARGKKLLKEALS